MRELAALERRIADLERRVANGVQDGVVAAVDESRHRVRLRLGGTDEEPYLSPWVPYMQHAGALKIHTPPSLGQQMTVVCPAGDVRRGRAFPFTWSEAQPSPSTAGDRQVLTYGDVTAELSAGGLHIRVGATEVIVSADGVLLKAPEIVTDGPTRLNRGDRAVVYQGSPDSAGNMNNVGASDVFV